MRKLLLGTALAACSALGYPAPEAVAQGLVVERITATAVGRQQVYVVKFLCGRVDAADDPSVPGEDATHLLGPGNYLTAINILNLRNAPTNLRARVVEALPPRDETDPRTGTLGPAPVLAAAGALEIDCIDIIGALPEDPDGDFLLVKGFVVIQGQTVGGDGGGPQPARLEVVAVYTHTPLTAGGGDNDGGNGGGGTAP